MTSQRSRRGGLLDWLLEICFIALLVVIAIAAAVEVVKVIWPLLVILAIAVIASWGLALLVRWWRWRW